MFVERTHTTSRYYYILQEKTFSSHHELFCLLKTSYVEVLTLHVAIFGDQASKEVITVKQAYE
jgi:hypothetical protein